MPRPTRQLLRHRLVLAGITVAALGAGLLTAACCCGGSGEVDSTRRSSNDGGASQTVVIDRADLGVVCAAGGGSGLLTIPINGAESSSKYADSDELVRAMLQDMAENAGLRRASIPPVIADPSVGSSVAVAATLITPHGGYPAGQRLILYSPDEVRTHTQRSGTTGTIGFIFAHELGHHVNGHNVARPGTSSHDKELEADYYAGFLMGLSGERKRDTLAWIKANVGPADSASHPGRNKRLASAQEGWEKGCQQINACNE